MFQKWKCTIKGYITVGDTDVLLGLSNFVKNLFSVEGWLQHLMDLTIA
jgi:hypothetical protein